MGCPFDIVVYSESDVIAQQAIKKAFSRIRDLDLKMSDYLSNSEIRKLTRKIVPDQKVSISQDLLNVLKVATQLYQSSHGAYDVCLKPLSLIWRQARFLKVLPEASKVSKARSLSNSSMFTLYEEERKIAFHTTTVQFDLGSIAKGYALDEALNEVRRCGIQSAMINGSGDIAVSHPPPGKKGWSIQLDYPDPHVLLLENTSIATSGAKTQFFEWEGKKYSHIIDPRDGMALSHPYTVSVIHKKAMWADALASAFSVLGPKEVNFLKAMNAGVCFYDDKDILNWKFNKYFEAHLSINRHTESNNHE